MASNEYHRLWYLRNKDRILAKQKDPKWRARKRAWTKKDYTADPQKYRDRQNAWRKKPENRTKNIALQFHQNRTVHRKYAILKLLAKKRGQLELSKQEYIELIKPNLCDYCKGPLSPTGHNIDRIDSSLGYVKGNMVPCCTLCNTRKGYLEGAGFLFPRNVELLKELIQSNAPTRLRKSIRLAIIGTGRISGSTRGADLR